VSRAGDDGEHAEAGPVQPTLAVAAPLRVRPAEQAPSQGRRGLRTAARHRRAPVVRRTQEGSDAH